MEREATPSLKGDYCESKGNRHSVSLLLPAVAGKGEWVIGALINVFGSNFGTNLLKYQAYSLPPLLIPNLKQLSLLFLIKLGNAEEESFCLPSLVLENAPSLFIGSCFWGCLYLMFILGVFSVFIGISLLAPHEVLTYIPLALYEHACLTNISAHGEAFGSFYDLGSLNRCRKQDLPVPVTSRHNIYTSGCLCRLRVWARLVKQSSSGLMVKAKVLLMDSLAFLLACICCWLLGYSLQPACSLSPGLGEDSPHASSLLVMPMVSSKMTGFRGRLFSTRASAWSRIPLDEEDGGNRLEPTSALPQSISTR